MKTIFRVAKDKNNPYVMLDKRPLEDKRLSWKAKGIWAYLMSKPDDWQVILADIVKRATDGDAAVRSGIDELVKFGYMKKGDPVRNQDGTYNHHIWGVYESPTLSTPLKSPNGKPSIPRLSTSGLPTNGKPQTTNNELTNNELKDIKPTRSKTERDVAVDTLEDEFEKLTRIKKPPRENISEKAKGGYSTRWWVPLWNMYKDADRDIDRAKHSMQLAVNHMRKNKLIISAPQSIYNNFVAVNAENIPIDYEAEAAKRTVEAKARLERAKNGS